ncbi:MAG: hypothetical protein LBS01_09815 [Prevotellaceae bacterium]|nr:hypothetical protein [Prevotellaceae bacterium]
MHIFSEIDYIVNTLKHKTIYLECSDYYADTEHLNNLFGHIAENYNAVFSIELPLEFIIKFVKNDNNFPSNVRQIFINIKQINFVEHTLIVSSIKHLFDKGIVSIVLKCDEKTICQSENSITYFVTFSNEILQSVPNIEFYSVESVFEKAQQAIMQQVRNRILLLMQQNICKMTFEKKIKHVETNLSGVNTQIYAYFLTKTPIPKVYQNVKKQILSKFSFEIKDDFLLYCPVFYSIIEYDNEDKPYIPLSSFLTQSNDFVRYLNDIEFQLLQQAIRYKINKEIVNFISSQNKITFDEAKKMVVDFYLFVENVGLMSFTKILKKH